MKQIVCQLFTFNFLPYFSQIMKNFLKSHLKLILNLNKIPIDKISYILLWLSIKAIFELIDNRFYS